MLGSQWKAQIVWPISEDGSVPSEKELSGQQTELINPT
jgi:hypothetical protein